jgi:hypothetical protein
MNQENNIFSDFNLTYLLIALSSELNTNKSNTEGLIFCLTPAIELSARCKQIITYLRK